MENVFVLFFDIFRWNLCFTAVQVIRTEQRVIHTEHDYRQEVKHNLPYWTPLKLCPFNAEFVADSYEGSYLYSAEN
jgi:hypothetical protein